jgi:hypothetical protein
MSRSFYDVSNHKRKYFRDPTTPRIPQSFKYNGVNKEQWNLFVQKHTEELMKIGKGYLLNEEELRRRRTPPLRPPIIPVPHHETNAAANIRVTNQRRDDREYEKAKERYDRDQREMEADFDLALACAGDLCTDRIKTDIFSTLNEQEYRGLSASQKYQRIMSKLKNVYGPCNQGDVEALRRILNTLDGDELGWQRAIQTFDQTVTSMEMTVMRAPDGTELYQERRPQLPEPPAADANEEQINEYHQQVIAAVTAANELPRTALNYRPTDEQLKVYLINALKRSKISQYYNISTQSVLDRNLNWTYRDIRKDIIALAQKDIQDAAYFNIKRVYSPDQIRMRGASEARVQRSQREYQHGHRYYQHRVTSSAARSAGHERSKSRSRSRDRASASSSKYGNEGNSKGDSKKVTISSITCFNCGKAGHAASECISTKCGTCGGNFDSADERRIHYGQFHAKTARTTGPRGRYHGRERHDRSRSRSPGYHHRSAASSPGRTPNLRAHYAECDDHDGARVEELLED